jgi:hypothetical protein
MAGKSISELQKKAYIIVTHWEQNGLVFQIFGKVNHEILEFLIPFRGLKPGNVSGMCSDGVWQLVYAIDRNSLSAKTSGNLQSTAIKIQD